MSYTSPSFKNNDFEKYLDVDFAALAADCGVLMDNGQMGFGWVPPADTELDGAPIFEAQEDMIPEDQWKDRIAAIDASPHGWLERFIKHIFAQGREPSCVHNAAGQGMSVIGGKVFGVHNVVIPSPISSYRYCGTRSSGSSVPGALDWMMKHGQLPADTPENRKLMAEGKFKCVHPFTGYSIKPSEGFEETAMIFRIREYQRLTTVQGWFTALIKGFPCIGGRDMHCICHVRPAWDDGPFSDYANSWDINWGFEYQIATGRSRGFGRDSRRKVATMVSRGAWCVRDVYWYPWLS
jgi:hypothetical protein